MYAFRVEVRVHERFDQCVLVYVLNIRVNASKEYVGKMNIVVNCGVVSVMESENCVRWHNIIVIKH